MKIRKIKNSLKYRVQTATGYDKDGSMTYRGVWVWMYRRWPQTTYKR